MKDSTQQFYDSLADDYHLVFQNWDQSMDWQAKVIDQLIKKYIPTKPQSILDCTCGIGTQSFGLSQLGYNVLGTDLSSEAIERAKKEAEKRNLEINFKAVDIRNLSKEIEGKFDVVISFDNSLPHLTDRKDLLLAAQNILSKMNPNSLFMGSIRDYDDLLTNKPKSTLPVSRTNQSETTITFQTWDWQENNTYVVNHFTLKGKNEQFETKLRKATYRAYSRQEMKEVFEEAGFTKVIWLIPEESGFYQPVFVALN